MRSLKALIGSRFWRISWISSLVRYDVPGSLIL